MLSNDGLVISIIKFEHSCVTDYKNFVRLYKDYPRTSLEVESLGQSFIILADNGGKKCDASWIVSTSKVKETFLWIEILLGQNYFKKEYRVDRLPIPEKEFRHGFKTPGKRVFEQSVTLDFHYCFLKKQNGGYSFMGAVSYLLKGMHHS